MASDKSRVPWTEEQCRHLNERQKAHWLHPYTCGGNRHDEAHRKYAEEHGDGENGLLVATPEGWVCPVPGCGYTQQWAHGVDAAGTYPEPPF